MQAGHECAGDLQMVLQQQEAAKAPHNRHRADCLPHASTQVGASTICPAQMPLQTHLTINKFSAKQLYIGCKQPNTLMRMPGSPQGQTGAGALHDCAGRACGQHAPGGRARVDRDPQLQKVPPPDVHGTGKLHCACQSCVCGIGYERLSMQRGGGGKSRLTEHVSRATVAQLVVLR